MGGCWYRPARKEFGFSTSRRDRMNRRLFLTGCLPASSAFGYNLETLTPEAATLTRIHGNLIQNFQFIDAIDLCGNVRCYRTLQDLKKKNEFGKHYGNCRDYNVLLISQILNEIKPHIQSVYCYQDNTAHLVCYHPPTHLVFDNWVLLPKTWGERTDLTRPTILWDSWFEKWNSSTYQKW